VSYTVNGGVLLPKRVKLTTTSATTLHDADRSGALILSIIAVEIAGATPTLTLDIYDGTTTYYLQNAVAMTAKQRLLIDLLVPLKVGEKLRATASAADQIDVHITYSPRDATSQAGGTFIPLNQR
jgi:hypothetical protein